MNLIPTVIEKTQYGERAYDIYSRLRKRALTIDNEADVVAKLKQFVGWETLVEILLSDRYFRRNALADIMGYETEMMKKLMNEYMKICMIISL